MTERGNAIGTVQEILSVTDLTEIIRTLLEESFDLLWVQGEVSNLRRPASGHLYFTLKDARSQIRAVMFRTAFSSRRGPKAFALEEGMQVICRARLTVYEARGEYQLVVEGVEPQGLGALQKAFEQLKARLQAEGLFDPARKKRIPAMPGRIGVITSPTGAVIQDILTVTARRFPSTDILVAPVRVQGAEAAADIVQAFHALHRIGGVDVIILARGGGSLEDLAPFNDEAVARAIAHARIPVIAAIGHETDFTIADFVADLRAPTPSAAAELAVPNRRELLATLRGLRDRLETLGDRNILQLRERIRLARERLRDPQRIIGDLRMAIDDRTERMYMGLRTWMTISNQRLDHLEVRLRQKDPRQRIAETGRLLEKAGRDLDLHLRQALERRRSRLLAQTALMDSLSPLAVLQRGYSITRRWPAGLIIRSAAAVRAGDEIHIQVSQGGFRARVDSIDGEERDGEGKV